VHALRFHVVDHRLLADLLAPLQGPGDHVYVLRRDLHVHVLRRDLRHVRQVRARVVRVRALRRDLQDQLVVLLVRQARDQAQRARPAPPVLEHELPENCLGVGVDQSLPPEFVRLHDLRLLGVASAVLHTSNRTFNPWNSPISAGKMLAATTPVLSTLRNSRDCSFTRLNGVIIATRR